MNLCSDGHDEICYEGRNCPACELRSELEGTIEDLEKELAQLKNYITQLEKELGQ